jgi:hypothetical protein
VQPDEPANGSGAPDAVASTGRASMPRKPRAPSTPATQPPGIREQVRATFAAGKRLVQAHVDLAKAEASDIVDEVKKTVGLALAAIGLLVVTGILVTVGGMLFLGEWLFGSIGWGVLLGAFLFMDLAAMALLFALGVRGARLGGSFGVAAVLGIVVGLALGFDVTHRAWSSLADTLVPTLDPSYRVLLTAVVALAIVGGVVGLILGIRGGGGASIGGLIGGAVLGAILGVITSIAIPSQVGAALGVLVALIAWPILAGREVLRTGIDGEALRQRFMPDQTIEMTKETIEWARARTPLAPKS